MNDAIIWTKGGLVSLEKLEKGADTLRALESTVLKSSGDIQARLGDTVKEAGLRFSRTSKSLRALHYSLVNYNESWPYHLASLHEDLAKEEAAANGLLRQLRNLATKHPAPSWYYNTDVQMQKRVLNYSTDLHKELNKIAANADYYEKNVTRWRQTLASLDGQVCQALVHYSDEKGKLAMQFTSVYLGLNRQDADKVDGIIRQIIWVDKSVCEATDVVVKLRQESANAVADLDAIIERLIEYTNRCESEPSCGGLQTELNVIHARVQKLGPAYIY
ncbi:MAG: hypothetical protein Q9163_000263 [Psora crenata]